MAEVQIPIKLEKDGEKGESVYWLRLAKYDVILNYPCFIKFHSVKIKQSTCFSP